MVKHLLWNPDGLNSTPRIHIKVEKENQLHKVVVWSPHVCSEVCAHIYRCISYTHAHIIIIFLNPIAAYRKHWNWLHFLAEFYPHKVHQVPWGFCCCWFCFVFCFMFLGFVLLCFILKIFSSLQVKTEFPNSTLISLLADLLMKLIVQSPKGKILLKECSTQIESPAYERSLMWKRNIYLSFDKCTKCSIGKNIEWSHVAIL